MKCCQKKRETFNTVIESTDTRVDLILLKLALPRYIYTYVCVCVCEYGEWTSKETLKHYLGSTTNCKNSI